MKKKRIRGAAAALLAGIMLWQVPVGYCADLSLQDAIDLALARNTSLRITQKGEETAEAALKSARGENGVSVTAVGSLGTEKNSSSKHAESSSASLTGSIPIYTGGRNQAAIKSASVGVEAARLTTERQRENVKLSVILAYYNAVQAKKTIAVRQEAVDNYEAHYANVEQLFTAGSRARIDVIRSSVELSNARYELINAQDTYEVRLAILRDYININREEPLNLTEDFSYDAFGGTLQECIDYAYGHRKDLLVDVYTLEQRELAVKMAKAGYLPSVSVSAGGSVSGSNQPSWDWTNGLSARVSASWNIFDSGVTRAAVESAETARDVAQLTLDRDWESIDLALRQAYFNMRGSEEQLRSTADAVDQAKEDYFIESEKYRAGEGIMLDVLDAQKSLSDAELNHISAQYDYMRYKATVENAMGISLTERDQKAAGRLTEEPMRSIPASDIRRRIERMQEASAEPSSAAAEPDAGVAPSAGDTLPRPRGAAAGEHRMEAEGAVPETDMYAVADETAESETAG